MSVGSEAETKNEKDSSVILRAYYTEKIVSTFLPLTASARQESAATERPEEASEVMAPWL